jgi:hypothetical protein
MSPRYPLSAVGLALLLTTGLFLGLSRIGDDPSSFAGEARIITNGKTFTGEVVTQTTPSGLERVLVRYRTGAGEARSVDATAPGVVFRGRGVVRIAEPVFTIRLAGSTVQSTVTLPGATGTVKVPSPPATVVVTETGPTQTATEVQTVTVADTHTVTEVVTVVGTLPVLPP